MEKVSVVIPFYNCPFIHRSVYSALNQTYPNIEVIVVNDGSTKYVDKLEPFYSDIQYIEKQNGGTASALNEGIKHATGDYFSWLSSDDLYDRCKTSTQLQLMKNKNALVSYTDFYSINCDDVVTSGPIGTRFPLYSLFLRKMKRNCVINGCTVMLNMNVFFKIGLFDETLRYTHDYDLWRRLLPKYHFYYIDSPLVFYRIHQKMATKRFYQEMKKEFRQVRNIYNQP